MGGRKQCETALRRRSLFRLGQAALSLSHASTHSPRRYVRLDGKSVASRLDSEEKSWPMVGGAGRARAAFARRRAR